MATETTDTVTETVGFVREDAPTAKRGRKSLWAVRLAPLVDLPGEEYRITGITFKSAQAVARVANGLNTGKLATPDAPGTWKFKSRTLLSPDGSHEYALYGTYTAPKSTKTSK